jgi:hypothetical protein
MAVLRNREPLYRTGFYKDPNLNYYIHYYAEFILKQLIELSIYAIAKKWLNLSPSPFACMSASIWSETCAKTVPSQVFRFFSRL